MWNLELQDMKCDTKNKSPLEKPKLYHAQYKGSICVFWDDVLMTRWDQDELITLIYVPHMSSSSKQKLLPCFKNK